MSTHLLPLSVHTQSKHRCPLTFNSYQCIRRVDLASTHLLPLSVHTQSCLWRPLTFYRYQCIRRVVFDVHSPFTVISAYAELSLTSTHLLPLSVHTQSCLWRPLTFYRYQCIRRVVFDVHLPFTVISAYAELSLTSTHLLPLSVHTQSCRWRPLTFNSYQCIRRVGFGVPELIVPCHIVNYVIQSTDVVSSEVEVFLCGKCKYISIRDPCNVYTGHNNVYYPSQAIKHRTTMITKTTSIPILCIDGGALFEANSWRIDYNSHIVGFTSN